MIVVVPVVYNAMASCISPINTTVMQYFSSIIFSILLIPAIPDSKARSRIVSGVVTSPAGSRMPEGVTVSVKGFTSSSRTLANGVYYIRIESTDSVLAVAFPGYETSELKLTGSSEYNIALHPAHQEHNFLRAFCRRCSC